MGLLVGKGEEGGIEPLIASLKTAPVSAWAITLDLRQVLLIILNFVHSKHVKVKTN